MAVIPKDPVMLLSYINTQLRDQGLLLEELCRELELDQKELEEKLKGIQYFYDREKNQFI